MSLRGRRGRDRNVVGFTTAYAINVVTTNVVNSNPTQERNICDKSNTADTTSGIGATYHSRAPPFIPGF